MAAPVSIGLNGRTPLDRVRALAPRIERLGFRTLWINDVPGGDSLAALRAAASVTDALELATGVVPLDRRPADTLDLDGLPADRLSLGIGSGSASVRPLGLVRDGLRALRARTDARLVVGALGPQMRRFAAVEGDGALLNWLTPAAAGDTVAELHDDAGARAVRGILYVRTIVDADARAVLAAEADGYERVPAYAANFARLGIRPIDATIDLSLPGGAARVAEYRAAVDEVVLRAITPGGSLPELEAFVETAAAIA